MIQQICEASEPEEKVTGTQLDISDAFVMVRHKGLILTVFQRYYEYGLQ
jgi:hypothetical protein